LRVDPASECRHLDAPTYPAETLRAIRVLLVTRCVSTRQQLKKSVYLYFEIHGFFCAFNGALWVFEVHR
jgi:hypothetical protein